MTDHQAILERMDEIRTACANEEFDAAGELLNRLHADILALQLTPAEAPEVYAMLKERHDQLTQHLRDLRDEAQGALQSFKRSQRSNAAYRTADDL